MKKKKRFKRTKVAGNKTRSGYEAKVLKDLGARKVSYEYEGVTIEYPLVLTYTPDILLDNGIIVEMKGFWDGRSRNLMKTLKQYHPNLDIRMLFQRDNKLNKTSKIRYSDWCNKHFIKWAVGESIPEEWVKEPKKTSSG